MTLIWAVELNDVRRVRRRPPKDRRSRFIPYALWETKAFLNVRDIEVERFIGFGSPAGVDGNVDPKPSCRGEGSWNPTRL